MDVAIVFCPVCASNVDVEAPPSTAVDLECVSCSQVFTLKPFDPERIASYGHG